MPRKGRRKSEFEAERDMLYRQTGELQVEVDWLKKDRTSRMRVAEKRSVIDPGHRSLSVSRQCALIGLPRASFYRRPGDEGSPENLELIGLIDEEYARHPFYGTLKMTVFLRRLGYPANRKRVQRLMRKMGLESIAQKLERQFGGTLPPPVSFCCPYHLW